MIHETCQELLKARKDGKLTQESLDYELAKLSLEIAGDYEWRSKPSKPIELEELERLTSQDVASMPKHKYSELVEKSKEARKKYSYALSQVEQENRSNYEWLKICQSILFKKNHPGYTRLKEAMYTHEAYS